MRQCPVHQDPDAWPGLLEQLSVEAILVVIGSWMGAGLRRVIAAEDIWQETLYMAWRDRDQHQWRDLQSYRRWLLGIARNRVRDAASHASALKRRGDRDARLLSELGAHRDNESRSCRPVLPPDTVTPSLVARQRERAQAMAEALSSLPEEYQDAVRLRLFERQTLAEVAAEIGVSLATAKRRVYLGSALYRTNLHRVFGSAMSSHGERITR